MMAVSLIGCSAIGGIVKRNKSNIQKLSLGIPKAQVLEIMGPADKSEAYRTKSGGTMEFLFYRIQVDYHQDRQDKHWIPVCIIDGKLEGWGRNFYDDTIKIRKEIIRK